MTYREILFRVTNRWKPQIVLKTSCKGILLKKDQQFVFLDLMIDLRFCYSDLFA